MDKVRICVSQGRNGYSDVLPRDKDFILTRLKTLIDDNVNGIYINYGTEDTADAAAKYAADFEKAFTGGAEDKYTAELKELLMKFIRKVISDDAYSNTREIAILPRMIKMLMGLVEETR